MKYIMDTYGRFLLTGAIVALVFGLLFGSLQDAEGNRGVLQIIGARLAVEHIDYSGYTDFDGYQSESAKGMPVLSYECSHMVYAGEAVPVTDFIKGRDADGNALELRILKASDADGNDITSCYDRDTKEIRFPSAGIYRITAAVRDSSNKKYTCAIRVPVNKM